MSITDEEYGNPWLYRGSKFSLPDEQLEKLTGFVYVIHGLAPEIYGKKYVGQKLLWSRKKTFKTNPKTKVKRATRVRIESEWKAYYGSSEFLKADVAKYGRDNFRREIIHVCETKSEMNYVELREQMDREVLLKDEYYNSFVGGKIHGKHLDRGRLKR